MERSGLDGMGPAVSVLVYSTKGHSNAILEICGLFLLGQCFLLQLLCSGTKWLVFYASSGMRGC